MMSLIILSTHLGVMEHSPSSPQLSTKEEPSSQDYVAKAENFERHLAAVASAAAAAAAVAAAANSAGSTQGIQAKSNSSFLIEDILHQKQKSEQVAKEDSTEDKSIEHKTAAAPSSGSASENNHNFGANTEMALSRLHDYGNLAAYFTSHAAAAMASSATSPMSGFLQQHGHAYLTKTHPPIPSPFFLPTGKNNSLLLILNIAKLENDTKKLKY